MSKTATIILFGSMLLGACTSALTPEGAKVQEADEKMVEQCTFVGNVSGISMAGNTQKQAMERARDSAKNDAAALGATHVILGDITPAQRSYTIFGRAYRCGAAQ
jgi:hypothetical protein